MNLVYAIVRRTSPILIEITKEKPESIKITGNEWFNGYERFGPPPKIGSRTLWWDQYRPGTVVAIYDLDEITHVNRLSMLYYDLVRDEKYQSFQSRESSI